MWRWVGLFKWTSHHQRALRTIDTWLWNLTLVCVWYSTCLLVRVPCLQNAYICFILTNFFHRIILSFTWISIVCLCVCVCVCQPESASIHCLRSPGDDVETKHFWPASLPRCGDWFSGVTAVFLSHKTVLSSTEQMALYGVASVYYRKRGQKVLTVEWFVSMQAQHTHICFTNLIFHVKWCPSYCLYAHNRLCRSLN